MRQIFILLVFAGLFACQANVDPCPVLLQKRDYALTNSLDSMLFHRDEMPEDSFRAGMQVLRTWELKLFDDVRHCNFDQDLTRSYYWRLGRLKSSSHIQQALERLDSTSSQAPTR